MIKVGTCGFPVSMKKLFESLDAVETQKTFYTIVNEKTLQKWRNSAPENFEFTVKALQVITHPFKSPTYKRFKGELGDTANFGFFKDTPEVSRAMEITLRSAEVLRARVIVFQTPASFKPTDENISNILNFFKKWQSNEFSYVWEPRGQWDEDTVRMVLKETGISHAVDPFKGPYLGGDTAYFRLHGRGKGYRYEYSDEELQELLKMVPDQKPTYVMFNNTNMFEDALKFKEIAHQSPSDT